MQWSLQILTNFTKNTSMSDFTTPIVVIAYNRPNSLARLLRSLELARYPNENIALIISIDRGNDNQDVLDIANEFKWLYGSKTVNYQKANLGLRKHVLKCGSIAQEHGSVILLEDDLYVSPNFYFYTQKALLFSKDKEYVGGISLYNHQLNVHTTDIFSAIEDKYDNWYFQFASSWGQVWTDKQFTNFYEWYTNNQVLTPKSEVPKSVSNWSERSWLKFFIAFLIEKDRYFLYPKISHSTNFGDSGTHVKSSSTNYQVPLSYSDKTTFLFSEIEESDSVYDSFYENKKLSKVLKLKKEDLCIDLYGHKPNHRQKRYYLTSKSLNFKIIKSFSRSLRPIDSNIIKDIQGQDLFLYDTLNVIKNPIKIDRLRRLIYNYKAISYKSAIYLAIKLSIERLKKLF